MRMFRYLSVGRTADAQRLCAALPKLAKFWKGPGDGNEGVLQCYRQAMEEAHLLDEAELTRGRMPARIKQARRDHMRRHHQTIRRRRRRVLTQSWYGVDGTPLVELDLIGDALHEHWSHAFRERPCSPSAAEVFLRYAQDSGMSSDWIWPRGLTRDVVQSIRDSSPGSDGLTYSFWRVAPDVFHRTVDDLMELASSRDPFPIEMSHTTMVPIPKAEVEAEATSVRCTAPTIRPITLMRVSAKIGALVANQVLAPIASQSVAAPQRGFLAHRVIDEDILGLDGAMAVGSLRPDGEAAAMLFDFEAAFPSLGHGWVFLLLRAMRLAPRFCDLVETMYLDLTATFVVGGHAVASIRLRSGIRQGCPLSGTLFAVALDLAIRYFLAQATFSSARIFAFADDLAVVLTLIARQLAPLAWLWHGRRRVGSG